MQESDTSSPPPPPPTTTTCFLSACLCLITFLKGTPSVEALQVLHRSFSVSLKNQHFKVAKLWQSVLMFCVWHSVYVMLWTKMAHGAEVVFIVSLVNPFSVVQWQKANQHGWFRRSSDFKQKIYLCCIHVYGRILHLRFCLLKCMLMWFLSWIVFTAQWV